MPISNAIAPHPFTLRQLQYVVAVAESLSFRKAAERCRVAQPSLSAQLAQLEEAIGVQLFERDRRRVLLTSAGKDFIERAQRLLVDADDLLAASKRASDPFSGTLRVGVIPTISPYLLPSVTPALRAAYPRLTTLWVEDKTEVLMRNLDAGSLDAALLALEADLGEVDSEVVSIDPFVLAARPDDPLMKRSALASPSELAEANVLLLDDGHCLRQQALAVCSRAHARELEFRATSLSTLVHMVAAGAGVTLLPQLAVEFEAARAGLETRSFARPAPYRTIALVWRKRSPLSDAFKKMTQTIRGAYPTKQSAR